jgi:predicted nucleic acid-binding protein
MTLVVDASVAVKWFVPENDSDRAAALLASPEVFHAPEFLRLELANAIWKNVLRKRVPREVHSVAEPELERIIAYWHDPSPFIASAFAQACDASHPIHDFIYLTLARHLNAQLVSADRRFLAKAPPGAVIALQDWRP